MTLGSPPRVWGRRVAAGWVRLRRRFTPTGVGKTRKATPVAGSRSVHPHGCGEDNSAHELSKCNIGSPPRVWGRRRRRPRRGMGRRFTPTGVGKTSGPPRSTSRHKVHPHGCGEDLNDDMGHIAPEGSPPRVWGRLPTVSAGGVYQRFTPTGVGKTGGRTHCLSARKVHPHGCGEDCVGDVMTPSP